VIVAVEAEDEEAAQFQRADWDATAPVQAGTKLQAGDRLTLEEDAEVTLVCAGLEMVTVDAEADEVACDEGTPVLVALDELQVSRAPSQQAQVLLTPRKTMLLEPRPTLRWRAVDGVTVNQIGIEGPGVTWRTDAQGRTSVTYPANADDLVPGSAYQVVLDAETGPSVALEPTDGLGFVLLPTDEAEAVRSAEEQLRAMGLDEAQERILVADLYRSHTLYAEAMDLLTDSPAAEDGHGQLLLGDLALETGLNDLAETHYLQALELAAAGDIELQAEAHHQLGSIAAAQGRTQQAREHLEQARALYEQVGATQIVAQIDRELAEL
jgi:tetratricopeptide (TPR) repeat protein